MNSSGFVLGLDTNSFWTGNFSEYKLIYMIKVPHSNSVDKRLAGSVPALQKCIHLYLT